jgi:hypothetical protein
MIELSQALFLPPRDALAYCGRKNCKKFGHFARSRVLDKYEHNFIVPRRLEVHPSASEVPDAKR